MEQIVEKTVQSEIDLKNLPEVNIKRDEYAQPNRRERRKYLRDRSNYFKTKKHLKLSDWAELVASNNRNGRVMQEARNKVDMEKQEIFLRDRETKLKNIYRSQGLSNAEIAVKMDKWYENI
jgi:hypothetical protein